ncbi:MAG: methylmalonyl-CoA epimerase [Planctomycetota bacterium]
MSSALQGIVSGLHHVAIVVESIEKTRAVYEGALGMRGGEVEFVPDQKVRVLVVHAGAQRLELVEPASDDSPVMGFLKKRGPGLHHLAYKVENIERAIAACTAAGLRMIDEKPRPGAHNCRIAFVHPSATGGVLSELVEEPKAH